MEPTNALIKLQEGQKFLFDEPRDVKRAIKAFQETTNLSPEWAEGFIWLGITLLGDSLLEKSEQVLRQAIALDPKDSRPHLWLAQAHERQGNLMASVSCYRAGLALKPHYGEADARLGLASVLKKLGHLDEAISEWKTVANMEPMYPSYGAPVEEAKRELVHHS